MNLYNSCIGPFQTPVHLAVITNQSAVLDLFLQHDVDLTLADQQGNTSLHLACMDNNYSMLRSLCSYMKQKKYKDQVTSMLNYKGTLANNQIEVYWVFFGGGGGRSGSACYWMATEFFNNVFYSDFRLQDEFNSFFAIGSFINKGGKYVNKVFTFEQ